MRLHRCRMEGRGRLTCAQRGATYREDQTMSDFDNPGNLWQRQFRARARKFKHGGWCQATNQATSTPSFLRGVPHGKTSEHNIYKTPRKNRCPTLIYARFIQDSLSRILSWKIKGVSVRVA